MGRSPKLRQVIQKSRDRNILMIPSTSPVIFKRTKAKTAQRTRHSSDNDTEAATAATGEESPSTLATKLKNKVKKKTKSRLSFGGDEDEVCMCNGYYNTY